MVTLWCEEQVIRQEMESTLVAPSCKGLFSLQCLSGFCKMSSMTDECLAWQPYSLIWWHLNFLLSVTTITCSLVGINWHEYYIQLQCFLVMSVLNDYQISRLAVQRTNHWTTGPPCNWVEWYIKFCSRFLGQTFVQSQIYWPQLVM